MDRPALRWFASAAVAGYRENGRPFVARHPAPTLANIICRCCGTFSDCRKQKSTNSLPQALSEPGPYLPISARRARQLVIDIAFITHGVVADRMTISQAIGQFAAA